MVGMRVLVADDNVPMRRLLERSLEQVGKFEVDFAGTGTEALRFYRQRRHDLIVIDNVMPGKNGLEVLKDLRDDPFLKETHVIMVTGEVSKLMVQTIRSEMLKIDDLLIKPLDFEKFKAKVAAVALRVRRKASVNGPVLKMGEKEVAEKARPQTLVIDIIDRGNIAILEMTGHLTNDNRDIVSGVLKGIEGIFPRIVVIDINSVSEIDEFGCGSLAVMQGWIVLNGKEAFLSCDESGIGERIAALGLNRLVPQFQGTLK